jgi:hypothetical protein
MAKIKGCRNSKTDFETKLKKIHQKKRRVKTEFSSFWNQNQTTPILMQHHVWLLHGSIIEFKR